MSVFARRGLSGGHHAEAVDTHRDNARVWLDWSTAIREDVWPRYVEFQERIVETLAATIVRGQKEGDVSKLVDPEDDARLIVGFAPTSAHAQIESM